jgi:hypothetical protein
MRKPPKEFSIQPFESGVCYQLDSTYLSNLKEGQPHPVPVELYCFIQRLAAKPRRPSHFVHTFAAPTEKEALDLLREFASRTDVRLVDEKTRRLVPKEWLPDHEQA